MKQLTFDDNIEQIVEEVITVLKKGGLVVVPSDTIYGLSVDATNPDAVEKLIEFKSRPAGKPISVFVHSLKDAEKIAKIDAKQRQTLKSILPGRFTVVLPSKHKVDPRLESEKGTLGIRIIDHPFIDELTKQYPNPITATSANLSGTSPHYSTESLLKSLSSKKRAMINLIVDYGKLSYNKPSTVIDLTEDEIKILRYGDNKPKDSPGVIPLSGTPPGWRDQASAYISNSEKQTKQIAQTLIKKWEKEIVKKPLVIILQGELGAGKTQFVKGIGEYFGIHDIISPTFVVYYEYKILRHSGGGVRLPRSVKPAKRSGYLYHVDLYNVIEKSEFKHLRFENMLRPGNIICIEWGEKSGEIYHPIKERASVVSLAMNYIDEKTRAIEILFNYQ